MAGTSLSRRDFLRLTAATALRQLLPLLLLTYPGQTRGCRLRGACALGPDVSCFRFSKEGRPIYLMWSARGKQAADFSEESGQVRVTGGAGHEIIVDAAAVQVA
jgi:hypothetical protein